MLQEHQKQGGRRKQAVAGLVLLLLSFLLGALTRHQLPLREFEEDVPPSWREFTSVEGGFQVQMPGQPTYQKSLPPQGMGLVVVHKWFVFRDNKRQLFQVMRMDFPEAAVRNLGTDKAVEVMASGLAADFKGNLLYKIRIRLGDVPGAELEVKAPNGIVRARVYLSGTRGYHVVAAMPDEKTSPEEVQHYFESFRLLK
jgi:hypothetical protein